MEGVAVFFSLFPFYSWVLDDIHSAPPPPPISIRTVLSPPPRYMQPFYTYDTPICTYMSGW